MSAGELKRSTVARRGGAERSQECALAAVPEYGVRAIRRSPPLGGTSEQPHFDVGSALDVEIEPELEPPLVGVRPPGSSGVPFVLSDPPTSRTATTEGESPTSSGALSYAALTNASRHDSSARSEPTDTSGKSALVASERVARALDRIREDMTDDANRLASGQQIAVSATEGVALALSLGWLGLLLRGGSLAALAFSALPLWSRVDPLAVLAISEEERMRLEDDLRKAEEDEKERAVGQLLDAS